MQALLEGLRSQLSGIVLFLISLSFLSFIFRFFFYTKAPDVGTVSNVCISETHHFSKSPVPSVTLLKGLGIAGDCHAGVHVQHLFRINIRPKPLNLRQVHLIHAEFFEELRGVGHSVQAGELGENITTRGLDLLGLSTGTRLHFVSAASQRTSTSRYTSTMARHDGLFERTDHPILTVTGLRNPCPQIEKFQAGLQEHCVVRGAKREIKIRKSGIMAIVDAGGEIKMGDTIVLERPQVFEPLVIV